MAWNLKVEVEVGSLSRHMLPSRFFLFALLSLTLLSGCLGGGQPEQGSYTVQGLILDSNNDAVSDVEIIFGDGEFGTATTEGDGTWRKDGLSGTVTIVPAFCPDWAFSPPSHTVSAGASDLNFTAFVRQSDTGDPTGAEVSSPDGLVTLIIPAGALSSPEEIWINQTIVEVDGARSTVYEIGPEDILLSAAAFLWVDAAALDAAPGTQRAEHVLARLVDDQWHHLESSFDAAEDEFSAEIMELGTFALIWDAPPYEIAGTVRDTAGTGVPDAVVRVKGAGIDPDDLPLIETNSQGNWGPVSVRGSVVMSAAKTDWVFPDQSVSDTDKNIVIPGFYVPDRLRFEKTAPNVLRKNTATDVRVVLHVDVRPELLSPAPTGESAVRLYQQGDDGSWEFLGFLFDDGDAKHGDEHAGDRRYSNIVEITAGEDMVLKAIVRTKDDDKVETLTSLEVVTVIEGGLAPVLSVHEEARELLEAYLEGSPGASTAQALDAIAPEIRERLEVSEVAQHNNVLEIQYVSQYTSFFHVVAESAEGGIIRGRRGDRSSGSVPLAQQTTGDTVFFASGASNDEERSFIGSRGVLIWAPKASGFSPWDETDAILDVLAESPLGFDYAVYQDSEATPMSLARITEYGFVVLASHGLQGRWLATGEAVADEDRYTLALSGGQMGIWQSFHIANDSKVHGDEPVYAVNENWFASNLSGGFTNTVIVNNSCDSMDSDALWQALESLGAGAYFGYDGPVSSRFASEQAENLVRLLAVGEATTGDAYVPKSDPYYAPSAQWLMHGDTELTFPGGVVNNAFEHGLFSWQPDGDGRAVSALSFLEPTTGSHMAIISTGLGFTTRYGSIRQTFEVDPFADVLRFDWNYVSEEFLHYIGSRYQDPFRVALNTAHGEEVEVLYLTVDGIAAMHEASQFPSSSVAAVQAIESGDSGSLHPVSPAIAFDRGDVWMTGWQSHAFDVTPYRGQQVILVFEAKDVGDDSFDTAVLLDNVRTERADQLPDTYTLTVHTIGGGITYPSAGTHRHARGSSVSVTAVPDPEFEFLRWHGPVSDPESKTTVVELTEHRTVAPIFVKR